MTVHDLRDPAPGYGPVSMGSEDRIALSLAADRERVRLFRKAWHETVWGRCALAAGAVSSVATVVGNAFVVWHR